MANKVGNLIKKSRTEAGLTKEQLAKKVKNTSTQDIGKAERGELKLSQDALKQIAKATGVTQKSLLEAASSSTYKNAASAKKNASSSKTSSAAKKTTSAASKKTTSSAKKTGTAKKQTSAKKSAGNTSSSGSSMKVSSTERRLVELYRQADTQIKKRVMDVLKGTDTGSVISDALGDLLEGAVNMFTKK